MRTRAPETCAAVKREACFCTTKERANVLGMLVPLDEQPVTPSAPKPLSDLLLDGEWRSGLTTAQQGPRPRSRLEHPERVVDLGHAVDVMLVELGPHSGDLLGGLLVLLSPSRCSAVEFNAQS